MLVSALNAISGSGWAADNAGVPGVTAHTWAANLSSHLNAYGGTETVALVNLGTNDMGGVSSAQWIADMEAIVNEIHNKWPTAPIYIARPWIRGYDAMADTIAGWIDTVVAARPYCRLGPDERVWVKGADNGATMTTDGVHYSAAGQAESAAQWKTILGY